MEHVLQRHQRGVVNQVGVVDREQDRPEAAHRDQQGVEGGAKLSKILLSVLVDQRADRFDAFGHVFVGVTQRRHNFNESQQCTKGRVLFEVAATSAQDQARRSVRNETGFVQQGCLARAPTALDGQTPAMRRDGTAED